MEELRATHEADLELGGQFFRVAVLSDKTRVLGATAFLRAMGRTGNPKSALYDGRVPFLSANNIQPYIDDEIRALATQIHYKTKNGRIIYGYNAELLPKVCKVYLRARRASVLSEVQEKLANSCEILLEGFADLGIKALIDEVTGYQEERDRNELQKILEKYVSREHLRWEATFPKTLLNGLYKFHGVQKPRVGHHPLVGKMLNWYVYERLPSPILPELIRLNPRVDGKRKYKHHQFMTEGEDNGKELLKKTITIVETLVQTTDSKEEFVEKLDKVLPKGGLKKEERE